MGFRKNLTNLMAWMHRNPSALRGSESMTRICRFEQIERREMLSASPIHVAVITTEPHDENDAIGNQFQVCFTGGASNTQLSQLTIDTDKAGDGLTPADLFFDTASSPSDRYKSFPLTFTDIPAGVEIDMAKTTVVDGGTSLVIAFKAGHGLQENQVLKFKIDMDQFLGVIEGSPQSSAWTEDDEVYGSHMTASFTSANYDSDPVTSMMTYDYDTAIKGTGLENYLPLDNDEAKSAEGLATVQQTLKPITLSGTVYHDIDLSGNSTTGDTAIKGATLALWKLQTDGTYSDTGLSTHSGDDGTYSFTVTEEGTYKVVETNATGYLYSTGTTPGTTGGDPTTDNDAIQKIVLSGGDDSKNNDFFDAKPGIISGYVYHDANHNGLQDNTESGIGDVTVTLYKVVDGKSTAIDSKPTSTNVNNLGYYSFTVDPRYTYVLQESQPTSYFDGQESITTTPYSGTNDRFDSIKITTSGGEAKSYDFGEVLGTLSGHVYVDGDYSKSITLGTGEEFGGAILYLLDANGTKILDAHGNPITATTDSNGYYEFLGLAPGVYGIARDTVEDSEYTYLDWYDQAGTTNGNDPTITNGTPVSLSRIGTIDLSDPYDSAYAVASYKGVDYDFAVIAPATIAGHVYESQSNTGEHVDGDAVIPQVTVILYKRDASVDNSQWVEVASTQTGTDGSYEFTNVATAPNMVFMVHEKQPDGYLPDYGLALPGTVDGDYQGYSDGTDDIIDVGGVVQKSVGIDYDFTEIKPVSISGYVFQDGPVINYDPATGQPNIYSLRDGTFTPDDKVLAGVTLELADGSGAVYYGADGNPITTVTDANGYYEFSGLLPDSYTVIQLSVSGYIDATDKPGPDAGVKAQWVNTAVAQSISSAELWTIYGLSSVPDGSAIAHINAQKPGTSISYNNFSLVLLEPQTPSTPNDPPSGGGETPSPAPPTLLRVLPPTPGPEVPAGYYSQPQSVVAATFLGGGGFPIGNSWHLSVVNGGQPRATTDGSDLADQVQGVMMEVQTWAGTDMNQAEWILADAGGTPIRQFVFGQPGAWPVTGDWRGDGITHIGTYLDGQWFLDLTGDGKWDDGDLWARLGLAGDQPVTGDWDGDGKRDIGIFGSDWVHDNRQLVHEPGLPTPHNPPKGRFKNIPPDPQNATSGERFLRRTVASKVRADVIDHVFRYGTDGDMAIAGDWTGTGVTTIGVFRQGVWYLDVDGDGKWSTGDILVHYGQSGDLPVVGDWTGDGVKKLGVFRKGTWYLDVNNDHILDSRDKVIHLGEAGDLPVVGDWTGDGVDKPGIYRAARSAGNGQPPAATTQTRLAPPQASVAK